MKLQEDVQEAVVSDGNVEQAFWDGFLTLECPQCGRTLLTELDADQVYCDQCEKHIRVINPYF